ncbi:hypothetical protein SAMN04488023_108131 [Pedobacter rhizosphaerae]|uniref:Uncharacterized protein n=1 Tax=Pedobacter rhizosphaerae TaxID=390241 RepID=A0A1H9NVE1_9SPHI|nr:hypothetical protein SAMN04488023_108131 [Pedobacter rhizosphaerae]
MRNISNTLTLNDTSDKNYISNITQSISLIFINPLSAVINGILSEIDVAAIIASGILI